MDKLKINHNTLTKFKHKSVGFTLVELIIVITILAILATITFISFKNYSSNARDGNRMTTLKNIETWLLLFQTKTSSLPSPENHINIIWSGSQILSKQWYIWKNITSQIRLNTEVFDPKDNTQYLYSTNWASTKYQLGTYLEEQNLVSYFPQTYANVDYSKRFFYTIWNPVWIILDEHNSPLSITTDLILDENNTNFKVHFSNDSSSGSVSWTGWSLIEKITEYQKDTSIPVMQNNCSFSGATILHWNPITLYKLESIDKFDSVNTCQNNSLERFCNNWVLSGDEEYIYSNCVKWEVSNCSASWSYVYNWHTYNIPALNHSSSTDGLISASVSENNGTFSYTLDSISCNDWNLINPSEASTPTLISCNSWYWANWNSCNDITPPSWWSFTINNNAASTNSTTVTLNITCPTDISNPIQIAYWNTSNPTNWVNCTSSNISHILTNWDGNKTVFVRFRDSAWNISGEVSKSISLSITNNSGICPNSNEININWICSTYTCSDANWIVLAIAITPSKIYKLCKWKVNASINASKLWNQCSLPNDAINAQWYTKDYNTILGGIRYEINTQSSYTYKSSWPSETWNYKCDDTTCASSSTYQINWTTTNPYGYYWITLCNASFDNTLANITDSAYSRRSTTGIWGEIHHLSFYWKNFYTINTNSTTALSAAYFSRKKDTRNLLNWYSRWNNDKVWLETD